MEFNKNGCSIEFPTFDCPRNDCDRRMIKDKTAPDHYKSTGNFRYVCPNKHLRWLNKREIKRLAKL